MLRFGRLSDEHAGAMIDFASWDLPELSRRWRAAEPFSHIILDDFVSEEAVRRLAVAAGNEPYLPNQGEIFDFYGSHEPVVQPELTAFVEAFGSPASLAAMHAITGQAPTRVEIRAYVYGAGHYLLPHLDHESVLGRKLACAYYLYIPEGTTGGELELFDVTLKGRRIVDVTSSKLITPQANRMVLFEVSDRSLHQVREITAGARVSLAGWFY